MNYRHLELRCNCGEAPERIEEVGFTEDHQLVVHWWCAECRRLVYMSKPLAECWRECPPRDDYPLPAEPPPANPYGPEDATFLRRMGVKLN